jgi:hypothetical protein
MHSAGKLAAHTSLNNERILNAKPLLVLQAWCDGS